MNQLHHRPAIQSSKRRCHSMEETRRVLETADLFWLSTVRADGRPHVTPLVAVWHDGAIHFTTGDDNQKGRNLRGNPHVILTTGYNQIGGLTVVVEGDAVQITDQDTLERLASVWATKWEGSWPYQVRNGYFYLYDEDHQRVARRFEHRVLRQTRQGLRIRHGPNPLPVLTRLAKENAIDQRGLSGLPKNITSFLRQITFYCNRLAAFLAIPWKCWYSSFIPEKELEGYQYAMAKPTLLPDPTCLHLQLLDASETTITARGDDHLGRGSLPTLPARSARIYSRYMRTVADLPWMGCAVRLELHVRRFFCPNPECARQIFTERLPSVVAPYARRTTRLTDVFTLIGFALGGEAGKRLVAGMGLSASPDTLLRLIRAQPEEQAPTPRVFLA